MNTVFRDGDWEVGPCARCRGGGFYRCAECGGTGEWDYPCPVCKGAKKVTEAQAMEFEVNRRVSEKLRFEEKRREEAEQAERLVKLAALQTESSVKRETIVHETEKKVSYAPGLAIVAGIAGAVIGLFTPALFSGVVKPEYGSVFYYLASIGTCLGFVVCPITGFAIGYVLVRRSSK